MKIGLISDTHNRLNARIFEIFSQVDLIIHAGDIGSENILIELKTLAPVKAVYGNMDSFPLVSRLAGIDCLQVGGLSICVTHIVHSPRSFAFELFKLEKKADVVVSGHTHRAQQVWYKNILFVNPGSASQPRDSRGASVGVLTVENGKPGVEFVFF